MGVGKKYRGKFEKVLLSYVAEHLADKDDIDLERIFVTHAGCTISSHCGANTLGILFVRKTALSCVE